MARALVLVSTGVSMSILTLLNLRKIVEICVFDPIYAATQMVLYNVFSILAMITPHFISNQFRRLFLMMGVQFTHNSFDILPNSISAIFLQYLTILEIIFLIFSVGTLLMRSKKPRRAMDREDTWAQTADIAPRLLWRIVYNVAIASVCLMAVAFIYVVFFQGRTFTLPTVPTATSTSNAVKTEY